jgi:hypothetical protein
MPAIQNMKPSLPAERYISGKTLCCVGAKEKKKIHVGHVRKTLESLHFGGS